MIDENGIAKLTACLHIVEKEIEYSVLLLTTSYSDITSAPFVALYTSMDTDSVDGVAVSRSPTVKAAAL